jgi:hypothetical protein
MDKRSSILNILKDGRKSYYSTIVFPTIQLSSDDIYIITENGDRLDKMAYEFYKDSSYWWILAEINKISNDSLYPEVGIQMRIPSSVTEYLEEFEKINRNR